MSTPYIGEIRIFAGNFAPDGWMFCEGQLLSKNEYEALFNIIGTTYGGDGVTTFALPDLRGRLPIHQGNGFVLAETGGAEEITLTVNQIPAHTHPLLVNRNLASDSNPHNRVLAQPRTAAAFDTDSPSANMSPAAISSVGGSQPHTNLMPYLCVNFIISLYGIFPSPA